MRQMIELVDKHIKTVIITILHRFKEQIKIELAR